MLKTEINTKEIQEDILLAAELNFENYEIEDNRINTFFEHGHWWVQFYDEIEEMDRTYSVMDAEGVGTINGFDFEEV